MKIAQVAPLFESVPPQGYGGTERVVSCLTEELVRQGHQVTLFASGDSVTKARLCAPCPRSLRRDASCIEPNAYHTLMLERVYQEASAFDLVHFHTDSLHLPLSRRLRAPVVYTLHGRLDLPELAPLFQEFREIPYVSISNAQREPLPWVNWQATVYHGLARSTYTFRERPGDYLAFVGRISPEKQVDHAIEIARRAGLPLRIAAKVDPRDAAYYDCVAKLWLHDPMVEFLGEIGGRGRPLEREDLRRRSFARPDEVVVETRQLNRTPHVRLDHLSAHAPLAHDEALVDQLLDGAPHGGSRQPVPLREQELVLQFRARGKTPLGDGTLDGLGELEVQRHWARPIDVEGQQESSFRRRRPTALPLPVEMHDPTWNATTPPSIGLSATARPYGLMS